MKYPIAIHYHVIKEYTRNMEKVFQRLLSDEHRAANYKCSRVPLLSQTEDRLE